MAMKAILAAVAGLQAGQVDGAYLRSSQAQLSVIPMHTFKHDCGLAHPVSLAAAKVATRAGMPGAGTEPNLIVPFETVLKDSFYQVNCLTDFMYTHGDKFGDAKHEYLLGDVSNVSIVHYSAHVEKMNREEMTHEVCFSFCRTIPDMNFFGITNGRECYCMTYFQAMADDNSLCDEVCDGNPGTMCGGKTKSSIFGMHQCDSTAEEMATAEGKLSELKSEMAALQGNASAASAGMQSAADAWQKMLGNAGDPGAADLMQTAKEFAGELEHAAGAAGKVSETAVELSESVTGLKGADLADAAQMKEAEAVIDDIEEATTQEVAAIEELEALVGQAAPNASGSENISHEYYPIMYFVDKAFAEVPTTCTGKAAEKPMLGTMDSCAKACDADIHECVGFSYFPGAGDLAEGGLCFLMSKVETVKYWTGCGGAPADTPTPAPEEEADLDEDDGDDSQDPQEIQSEDLPFKPAWARFYQVASESRGQRRALLRQSGGAAVAAGVDAMAVQCVVKFAEFEGDTLKPNPSGKCDICLKEAIKADRCFV